jgi:hypothetical protein
VRVERARVERRSEAELREAVRPVAGEEDRDLAACEQRRRPSSDRVRVGRRLVELDVEGVQEPGEGRRIGQACDSKLDHRARLREACPLFRPSFVLEAST